MPWHIERCSMSLRWTCPPKAAWARQHHILLTPQRLSKAVLTISEAECAPACADIYDARRRAIAPSLRPTIPPAPAG